MIRKVNRGLRQGLLVMLILSLTVFSFAAGDEVNFVAGGGTAAYKIRFYQKDNVRYFSVKDLSNVFQLTRYWNEVTKKTTLIYEGKSIEIYLNNKKVKSGNKIIAMSAPAIYYRKQIHVPADFFEKILPETIKKQVRWDENAKTYFIQEGEYNLTGVRYYSYPDKTRVVVDLNKKLDYEVKEISAKRVEVKIKGGLYSQPKQKVRINDGLIGNADITQKKGVVQIVVEKGSNPSALKHFLLKQPYRIVLDFTGTGKKIAKKTPKATPRKKTKVVPSKAKAEKYRIKTVIIDPGHGGVDPGAVGSGGLREKNISLTIAKILKKMLEKNLGLRVVLTHASDVFVSLNQRAIIANRGDGDLFVSIHCNASIRKSARGHEVYFYNPDAYMDSYALSVARSENAVLKLEKKYNLSRGDDDTALILFDLERNEFVAVSAQLAKFVHGKLAGSFGNRRRLPVKSAPFYVLKYTRMPSILLEAGFITNKVEGKQLANSAYQKKLAIAVYEGIKQYKIDYEKKLF